MKGGSVVRVEQLHSDVVFPGADGSVSVGDAPFLLDGQTARGFPREAYSKGGEIPGRETGRGGTFQRQRFLVELALVGETLVASKQAGADREVGSADEVRQSPKTPRSLV